MGPDSAIVAAKAKLIVNSIRSGLTDPSYLGSEPWGCWGGNLSWWWDKNGDRNMFQADEWAWSTNYLRCIGYTGTIATKSGRLYGNTVIDPIWHTVDGVEIPEYNFDNARWISSYVDITLLNPAVVLVPICMNWRVRPKGVSLPMIRHRTLTMSEIEMVCGSIIRLRTKMPICRTLPGRVEKYHGGVAVKCLADMFLKLKIIIPPV